MAGKDTIITMKKRDLKRLYIIHKAMDGSITQREAASLLSISERHIRRIIKRIKKEGDQGITHRLQGRPSNRTLPYNLKEQIIHLYKTVYNGFGPTLFKEKLEEHEGIKISHETIRTWLMEKGLWNKHRRKNTHHRWRERKYHYGEMVQMDGSFHDWF